MNTHGLRLFYEVAKSGGMTKAANVMRISQPAVSSQIKKFENELGLALFEKKGRRLKLTEFGKQLAERAGSLFALEKDIGSFVEDYRSGRRGKLRIAATYLPASFLIPKWTAAFKEQYPGVDLLITTTNSKGACERLQHYEADIAVYGGGADNQPDDMVWDDIAEDELWFVVSPGHPLANESVSLEKMMQQPFVMREEGSSTRTRLISLCKTYGILPPDVALQFNGLHEAIRSVMTGYGANFISSLAVREYVERNELARVFVKDIHLKNKIAIGTRKQESRSPLMETFIKVCRQDRL